MKILTSRNGIALVAVLTILLVLTLLLPAMFTMSDTATKFSVESRNRQKASYFARSLCEMAVATYKNTYNVEVPAQKKPDGTPNSEYTKKADFYAMVSEYQAVYNTMFDEALKNGTSTTTMDFETVTMYENSAGDVQYSNEYKINDDGSSTILDPLSKGYNETGTGDCTISFAYKELCYLVDNDAKLNYEADTPAEKLMFNQLYEKVRECSGSLTDDDDALKWIADIMEVETTEVPVNHSFSVTRVKNKIVNFEAVATVRGKVEKRRCVVVLPTYPAEQNWLLYRGATWGLGNEVTPNPEAATGMTPINYNSAGLPGTDSTKYKLQNLMTFSCLGNMHITTNNLKQGFYEWDNDAKNFKVTLEGDAVLPDNADTFVLDVAPGINTTPDCDPSWSILDGINTAAYHDQTQCDNFIAMVATNSITVDIPITLIVNPARANRLGDGFDACYSIYKSLIFQAPTVVFGGQVDMLVSFYDRPGNGLADNILNSIAGKAPIEIEEKRMSSVILSTPATTEFRYNPKDENGVVIDSVKAGRVVFLEDCYVWVIDYADNGSGYSDHWYEVAQTVYYKNKDLTKIKLASAGDVYLYNAEKTMKSKDGKTDRPVGFSLAGYAIETIYYDKVIGGSNAPWWKIWERAQQDIFGMYVKEELFEDKTYMKDDFHLVGNIFDGTGNPDYLELPDADSIYTIWSS